MRPNLKVDIGGVTIKNPVMVASGTFGYGEEFDKHIDLNKLGGIVTKSITLEERQGHPAPRTCETKAGMLNAIGLANVGIHRFVEEKLPFLKKIDTTIIVNVAGSSVAEYVEVCRLLEASGGFDMIELNVSCPNVDKGGIEFGTDPDALTKIIKEITQATTRPIMVKLSPNVTSIVDMATAAQKGGASSISLINTLVGMAVDIQTGRPMLSNGTGGLSGPAIKPIAVAMVHKIFGNIDIPIIGLGGISDWKDAVEFMLVGATAIQVGTANFIDPRTSVNIVSGLELYLKKNKMADINDLIGQVRI